MAGPDTRIKDIGHDLVDNIAAELDNRGITVPDRKLVTFGQTAIDFEGDDCTSLLAVSYQGLVQGISETGVPGTLIRYAVPLVSSWAIGLFRCVPTLNEDGDPPTDEAQIDSFDELSQDAMTLPSLIVALSQNGDLVTSLEGCTLMGLGAVTPYGPSGGAGGSIVNLFISLV